MSQLNREQIEQYELIRRYVRDQLTPEETIEFENYFLDKPDLLDQIELETLLYQQLKQADDTSVNKTVEMANHSLASKLKSVPSFIALAAVVLLGVLLTFRLPDTPATSQYSVAQVVYIDQYRSVSAEQRTLIKVNDGIEELVLVASVEFHQHDYQVQLVRESTNSVLLNTRVNQNSDGEIALTLPVSQLHKGNYLLTLSAIKQPSARAQELYLQIIR